MRTCHSCGSRSTETPFPVRRIPSLPSLCLDCALEWASEATRPARTADTAARKHARARYRARFEARQASPQLDWVDQVTPCP